ncbi:DUF2502 domain-containing protein [Nissabacter sp. SGAir0207]|uniref:DUF2502 domain-containing protein n=1 Tax=Nissabacter sp. SGAir0207 TaxID=2126321 RepID=UPI0010CD1B5E|nr:DUF2502 domain-containing protein [Nissabacter sp. SGAir0207]QCR35411.1 hypothetical protein C1N62_04585 [Nissabacter sp. SGAir0207]
MVKVKTLLLSTLFVALLPAVLPAKAGGLDLRMPGLSLSIGDRDRHGNYWDGHRWRDRAWWGRHHPRFHRPPPPPPRWHHGPPRGHGWGHDHGHDHGRGHGHH